MGCVDERNDGVMDCVDYRDDSCLDVVNGGMTGGGGGMRQTGGFGIVDDGGDDLSCGNRGVLREDRWCVRVAVSYDHGVVLCR